jgi:roadblock/LC7 domain-containing protein
MNESMASLQELLKINGVAAAGQFTLDGKLVDYKADMDMSKEMAEMTAVLCHCIDDVQYASWCIYSVKQDAMGTIKDMVIFWWGLDCGYC